MDQVQEIFTDQIKLPKDNMREHIDRDELYELADDIKKNGLISPIMVRPKNGALELVAGQRRFLAHQIAGLIKIKCVVRQLTDDEALAIMTSENLARVDVNVIDEAKHVSRLMAANNNDIAKVSSLVGRGEKWVADRLAIGEMPDYLQEMLAKKEIKIGVALVLNQITDDSTRKMWCYQAVRDGVSVAMAQYWLADFQRRFLPGGEFDTNGAEQVNLAPPSVIKFRCSIDGQEYDVRTCKSIMIYEGNVEIFNAFVSAFREPTAETALSPGGN